MRGSTSVLVGLLCISQFLSPACSAHREGPKVLPVRVPVEFTDYNQKLQAAQVSVQPEKYTGACPVHIKTTGGITGAPGLTVRYRFIGNGLTWSPLRRSVIPASGMVRVLEVANIDPAHSGYFFRQLWVIVNGGTLDKYSNRALYTVSCLVPQQPVARRVVLVPDTPMYQGPCPKVVRFEGSISAKPGDRVRYVMFGNGAAWGPVQSDVIGRSGALPVSETLTVDAAHSGYFFRQIWVLGHDGGADTFSKRVTYDVTCLAGTPGPNASYSLFDISTPTDFATVDSAGTCAEHLEPQRAAMFCGAPLANGQPVLVWNWKQDGCQSRLCRFKIDGYRVYQTLGQSHRLITTQPDSALSIAALTQKTSDVAGNCYTVRAFFGNDESSDSNELCLRAGYGELLKRIVLRPVTAIPFGAGGFAARFNLVSLPSGATIWNARLQVTDSGKAGRPRVLCVSSIQLASAAVDGRSAEMVPTDPYLDVVDHASRIDVTSAVRAWAQGAQPNFGFILRAADPALAKRHRECASVERDLALAVDYLNL